MICGLTCLRALSHGGQSSSSASATCSRVARNGTIVSWNAGAERLYGYSEAEALGQPISMLVPEGEPDELPWLLGLLADGGGFDHFETVRRRKDGALIDVFVMISPIYDPHGVTVGASTIARDVTEQRRAERELAQARVDIDRFYNLALDVMAIARGGYFVQVNRAFEETLGYTREELMARPLREFIHPDDVEQTLGLRTTRAPDGVLHAFENRYRHKDGSYRWLLWSAISMEDGLTYATARDVTERKRMEDALREAEELLALSFEHSPLGMTLNSPDREVLRINRAFAEMLGRSVDELLADPDPKSFTHPDDVALDEANLRPLFDGEAHVAQWEKRYIHADGHTVWALVSVSLLRHADGSPRHLVSQVEDIANRRRMEEALRQSREQALAASKLKSEFVANMSHEHEDVMSAPDTVPLIDEALVEELLSDGGREEGILDVFLRSSRERLDTLEQAISTGDGATVARVAHRLKGA
jgi:PAS domain S-box-containing protein